MKIPSLHLWKSGLSPLKGPVGPSGPKGELGFPGRSVSTANTPNVHYWLFRVPLLWAEMLWSWLKTTIVFLHRVDRAWWDQKERKGTLEACRSALVFSGGVDWECHFEQNCFYFSISCFCLGTSGTTGTPRNVQLPQRSKLSYTRTHAHVHVSYQTHFIYLCADSPPLPFEDSLPRPSQASLQNGCKVPSVPTIKRAFPNACVRARLCDY